MFVVIGGALITPPLSAGILAGVTRDLILETATVGAIEQDVPFSTVAAGDVEEAFLTSTTRGVQAIISIDGTESARRPRTADPPGSQGAGSPDGSYGRSVRAEEDEAVPTNPDLLPRSLTCDEQEPVQ